MGSFSLKYGFLWRSASGIMTQNLKKLLHKIFTNEKKSVSMNQKIWYFILRTGILFKPAKIKHRYTSEFFSLSNLPLNTSTSVAQCFIQLDKCFMQSFHQMIGGWKDRGWWCDVKSIQLWLTMTEIQVLIHSCTALTSKGSQNTFVSIHPMSNVSLDKLTENTLDLTMICKNARPGFQCYIFARVNYKKFNLWWIMFSLDRYDSSHPFSPKAVRSHLIWHPFGPSGYYYAASTPASQNKMRDLFLFWQWCNLPNAKF